MLVDVSVDGYSEIFGMKRFISISWVFYFGAFLFVFFIKCAYVYLFGESLVVLGGGNDADYYDFIATGGDADAVNVWPLLLLYLSDMGLYSRSGVAQFLFFLSSLVLPYLIAKLCVAGDLGMRKIFWMTMFVIGSYPVLFFYSLDIYRDIFMIFVFLLGVFALRGMLGKEFVGWLFVAVVMSFFLFALRNYLGVAYALTVFYVAANRLFKFRRVAGVGVGVVVSLYLVLVYFVYLAGGLSAIIEYRDGFQEVGGSTTFGLDLNSTAFFLPNFILSWVFQVFGVWPFSGFAVVLLFVESIPFALALFYVLRNRDRGNKLIASLLVFFVIYNTIWVLGNDNLGTAWRLRSFGYVSIFICFVITYQNRLMIEFER